MPEHVVTVILDTNIFVAANWARSSASARLIRACTEGKLQAHYSKQVRREVDYVLRTAHIPKAFIASLETFWERAVEVVGVPVDGVFVEDPDDRKFLEAAVGGETDFLITNDEHLLKVRYVGRTEILTAGSAAKLLGV